MKLIFYKLINSSYCTTFCPINYLHFERRCHVSCWLSSVAIPRKVGQTCADNTFSHLFVIIHSSKNGLLLLGVLSSQFCKGCG